METGDRSSNWRDLARKMRGKGEFTRAVAICGKARREYPRDEPILRELGANLFQLDQIDEATSLYEKFVDSCEGSGPVWNDLGAFRFELRQHPAARFCFQEAISRNGRKSDYLCNLANACIETGLKREALRLLMEVLEKNPLDLRAQCLLGIHLDSRIENKLIQIGQRIRVSRSTLFSGEEENQEWNSRVEDLARQTVRISTPSSGWRNMPLRRGTRVILGYTGENSFWGTMGEVAGFVLDNIPLLEIRNAGSFQRIQRRSNVRISWGNTLQRICVAGEGNIPFEEENLSAAGVGVFTRNPQIPGEILSLQLDMEGEVLQIEGRVVRQVPHQKKGFRVGITFTDLDEIKQERLARYIHRLQLQRQKRRLP